jgi:hypothetical protein
MLSVVSLFASVAWGPAGGLNGTLLAARSWLLVLLGWSTGKTEKRPYVGAHSLLDGIIGLGGRRRTENGLMPQP